MSPVAGGQTVAISGFPRVSGDEPEIEVIGLFGKQFSPRERG